MRKLISLFLCVLTLCIGGCATLPERNANTDSAETEEKAPIYLELHFGNGEVLKKEIQALITPSFSGDFSFATKFDRESFIDSSMHDYFTSRRVSYTTAVFPDGQFYSMSDVMRTEADAETRTLIAYLWRDEPYQTEREYFETVEAKED